MTDHEHRWDLQLGFDGHGRIYGDFEGYVRRCKCGEYAPDFMAWLEKQAAAPPVKEKVGGMGQP